MSTIGALSSHFPGTLELPGLPPRDLPLPQNGGLGIDVSRLPQHDVVRLPGVPPQDALLRLPDPDDRCGPGEIFRQETHSPLEDAFREHADSTRSEETETREWNPYQIPPDLGSRTTTTTTRTIDGTSIETKETLEVGEPFDHYSCETTIRVGPNDNVSVTRNCDGSADVTINGVKHHLPPEQAKNLHIVREG